MWKTYHLKGHGSALLPLHKLVQLRVVVYVVVYMVVYFPCAPGSSFFLVF
jgi:hypothetical protein